MLKKILRIILIFLGLVAVLALLFAAALRLYFNEPRLKRLIADGTRGYLQRDASLGRVSVSLLTGIRMEQGRLYEGLSPRTGTFFSFDSLVFTVELFPLLQHEIYAGTFSLSSPALHLVRVKSGALNAGGFGMPEAGAAAALPLLISNVTVAQGRFVFDDLLKQWPPLLLDHIDLSARNVSLIAPFDARLSFRLPGRGGAVSFDGQLTVDPANKRLLINDLTASAGVSRLHLKGSVTKAAGAGKPVLDLQLYGDRAVLDRLIAAVPGTEGLQFLSTDKVNLSAVGTMDNLKITILPAVLKS